MAWNPYEMTARRAIMAFVESLYRYDVKNQAWLARHEDLDMLSDEEMRTLITDALNKVI